MRRPATGTVVHLAFLALIGAAIVGLPFVIEGWQARPTPEQERLAALNPGWAFQHRPVPTATERGSGFTVRLPVLHPDIGERRLARGDCREPARPWPAWFRWPPLAEGREPRCVHLEGEGQDVWVMDLETARDVSEVWEQHIGRDASAANWLGSGGWSGRVEPDTGADASAPLDDAEARGEPRRSGGWSVSPVDPSAADAAAGGAPEVSLHVSAQRHAAGPTQLLIWIVRPAPREAAGGVSARPAASPTR